MDKYLKTNSIANGFLLLLAAFIWGIAFVAQSVGMDYIGPFSFGASRFLLGTVVLLPVIYVRRKQNRKKGIAPADMKTTWIGGICCGLALCAASTLQQVGIQYTTVGKAGFITTLYIIIVPILGIFLKKKVPGKVWPCAVLAAIGMYLLCMSESLQIGKGDVLVFICAFLFAIQILLADHFVELADPVEISCIQFLTSGVILTILMFVFETPHWSDFVAAWLPIAYAGILSSGVAYTLQLIGQKGMDPTIASLLLSMESTFSVLAGWVILKQKLLMFTAVILVQLPGRSANRSS
jgi:drug/metabolite transporter (DMT)-like permease